MQKVLNGRQQWCPKYHFKVKLSHIIGKVVGAMNSQVDSRDFLHIRITFQSAVKYDQEN